MINKIVFCIVMFVQLTAIAQEIAVRDRVSLEVLSGAVISSEDGKLFVVTAADGKADISSLKESKILVIRMIGYEELSIHAADAIANGGKVYLTGSAFYMDEMVISASRFEEKEEDVAQQVQVIDSRELRFINQQTSADVLAQSGNVFVQKSQLGGGSPVIRGFEANKVQIVVDGVRMNNAIYRGGHLQDVITLDNNMMEKVEVSFGPGSVVYGSDALGGVMSFYTRRPVLSGSENVKASGSAFIRYSSANNENTGHIDFNVGGKRLASLTSFTYSSFDDLRQGEKRRKEYPAFGERDWYVERVDGVDSMITNSDKNVQVGSGYKQYDLLQKFLFKQNDFVNHQLNIQYSTSGNVPRYDRVSLLGSNGKPRFAEWYYGPQNRLLTSYTLSIEKNTKAFDQARVILSYQDIDQSRNQRNYQDSNLDSRIENVKVYALNADLMKQFGKNEFRYGAEVSYNDVTSIAHRKNIVTGEESPLDTRYPNGGSTMTNAALYITDSWEFKPWMIVNAGLRASNVGLSANFTDTTFYPFPFSSVQQNNTAVNGSLGLLFKTKYNWRISLLGATGFRAPNVDDLTKVFESVPGKVVVPNPDLKPERVKSLDLGIEKSVNDDFSFRATGYYTWYSDAITTGKSTFNGSDSISYSGQTSSVITSINATEAYIYGVSAQMTARVSKYFDLSSSINYTYGRVKTDSTDYSLDHIPPVFGRTGINFQMSKFRAEAYAIYNGWKKIQDYNMVGEDNFSFATQDGMPSWYTLNFRAAYSVSDYLQILASVDNILDVNYRTFSSNISAPGRNIVLTLKARL